jgi:NADH:ubiquinone oxidoreductase subunit
MGLFKSIARTLGVLSPTYLIFTRGEKVGIDQLGNTYYRAKPRPGYKRERRWVIYKGAPEASNIPPEWHGWIHHQTDTVPANDTGFRREWQKPHQPNLTGMKEAYRPPGHILEGGQRDKATGDYDAWKPE